MQKHPRYIPLLVARTPKRLMHRPHTACNIQRMARRLIAKIASAVDPMYADCGRATVSSQHLPNSHLSIVVHRVRTERQFLEKLQKTLPSLGSYLKA